MPLFFLNIILCRLIAIFICINNKTGMCHRKVISASQACIHQFKNLKTKLYNCNANIYFNKVCLRHNVTPNDAKIKISF